MMNDPEYTPESVEAIKYCFFHLNMDYEPCDDTDTKQFTKGLILLGSLVRGLK